MRAPRLSALVSLAATGLFGVALGCAVYVDPGEEGASCEDICGEHASCKKGVCVCDDGYDGFPENAAGCKPSEPPPVEGACERGCGLNAYCADDLCHCDVGAVSVCGVGGCLPIDALCDGDNDCPDGEDETLDVCNPMVLMDWSIIDSCADGFNIDWRLFSQDRDWVWPNADEVFQTPGLSIEQIEVIECAFGELICFGGAAGELSWGVGIDGADDCNDCCWQCDEILVEFPYLTCD